MKRVCLLLVVIICFSLLAFTAFAADGEETEEAPVTDSVLETDAASDQTEPIKEDELSSQTGLSVPLDSSGPYDETHGSYISGFNDGTFRPNDTLSRAEMAQILYNFGEYEEGPSAFPDVPADKWFAAPINALAHAGILKGFEDGRFHPMQAVTRAELVSVLYRLDGEPETESEPFSDVTDSYWAKDAINYAREKGWVSGYGDNTFRPLNQITRAEAVKVINRYLNRIPDAEAISRETEIRFFPDVLKTAWYYAEVMEAAVPHSAHYEAEGASETGSNYSPDTPHLKNGVYYLNGNLYISQNGCFVHKAVTGSIRGIPYTCTGETGVCKLQAVLVETWDGKLVYLSRSVPVGAPGTYQNGFYLIGRHVYAVHNGYFVNRAGTYKLNGITYTCEGSSGICKVKALLLNTWDGTLILLKNSVPDGLPGSYQNGFYLLGHHIYAVQNGYFVNKSGTYLLDGVPFTCEGENGVCKPDAKLLNTVDGTLVMLSDSTVSTLPGAYQNGFHLIDGNLYAVHNGYFVNRAGTYKLNGITYTCEGSSGICKVKASLLKTWDRTLVLLKNSAPDGVPGSYQNGFYLLGHHIYAVQNGYFVNKAGSYQLEGVPFTCEGENGVCKPDAKLLNTVDGTLVMLSDSTVSTLPGAYQNGFHLIDGNLYAVHNGYFVNRAGTYKLNGITYTCEGSSGICKVKASLLNIWDGTLVLLKNSVPDGLPGSYQNGFYLLGHHIYAVQNGYFVNKAGSYQLEGVPFTCEGENGVCKPDAKLLNTVDGTLVMLSDSTVSTLPGAYQNGFHLIDGNLYAVHNGYFVNRAGTYKLNGITYTCEGSSGICKVKASLLKTWDGTLVLLKNSVPNGLPGSYQNGFYRFGHHIYAVKGGYFVNSAGSYALNGVSFTCEGGSGVCRLSEVFVKLVDGKYVIIDNGELQTAEGAYDLGGALYCVKSNGYALVSGSWNTLTFGPDGKYTCGNEQIDAYINNVVTSVTNRSMTQEEKLKACFGYVFDNMVYLGNNNHVPRGADPSTWTETYMLRYINMGNRGNCYCFSSFMYYLARRLGYAANAISGAIDKTNDYDHGWMDIEIDGTLYIFDPELGRKWYEKDSGKYPRYRFFKMTYDSAPFLYVRY